jgi:hypothetical protein
MWDGSLKSKSRRSFSRGNNMSDTNPIPVQISKDDLITLLCGDYLFGTELLWQRLSCELPPSISFKVDEAQVAIAQRLCAITAPFMAERLLANQPSEPLIGSATDRQLFANALLPQAMKVFGFDMDKCQAEITKVIDGFFAEVLATTANEPNPYVKYWRWVGIVCNLASEREIDPFELLSQPDARDEIARRRYSKQEFVAQHPVSGKIAKPETIDQVIDATVSTYVDTLLTQSLVGAEDVVSDEEIVQARIEAEQHVRQQIEPQARAMIGALNAALQTWLTTEANRIYGQ